MNPKSEITVESLLAKYELNLERKLCQTFTGEIYLCKRADQFSIIKIFNSVGQKDEAYSALAMQLMPINCCAEIYAHDSSHIWMEFLPGHDLKTAISQGIKTDKDATIIACHTLNEIHTKQIHSDIGLPSLEDRFHCLLSYPINNEQLNELLEYGCSLSMNLLKEPSSARLLHGDFHHENILQTKEMKWKAIDAKGLIGNPIYDYANLFLNPSNHPDLVINSQRIHRMANLISAESNHDANKVLEWALAHACLSITWSINDKQPYQETLYFVEELLAVLGVKP